MTNMTDIADMTDMRPEFREIRQFLLAKAEADFCRFNAGLVPGAQNMLGVRVPLLRAKAREICRGDWRLFLEEYPAAYYEELMLQGLVLAGAKLPMAERLQRLADYLPRVDNWAVCDCVCSTFRLQGEEKRQTYEFMLGLAGAEHEYSRRFVLVMLLGHYVEPEYAADICRLVEEIPGGEYYVDMAKAWLISVLFVKEREVALTYLQRSRLDDFTFNKAIQKIRESRRVSAEDKALVLAMKRK